MQITCDPKHNIAYICLREKTSEVGGYSGGQGLQ